MPRILIADDEAYFRHACSRSLSTHGHQVEQAADGEEVMRLLRAGRYDLVLLDLAMPVLDGTTVLRAMREEAALAAIPVIVVTALGEADAARRVRGMNVRGMLIKSRFGVRDLLRHVLQAVPALAAA